MPGVCLNRVLVSGLLAACLLAAQARAQTTDAFNLSCTPQGSTITGTNTFGYPLSLEDYQGVVDEVKLYAVDLKQGTSCHPDYCTAETFGSPQPLASVSPAEIVFSDVAAREVESNDYNVMAFRETYDRTSGVLTVSYAFYDEAETTPTGAIVLSKTCTQAPYGLSH